MNNNNLDWYNLEDRNNYGVATYVIVTEEKEEDIGNYHMIVNYEEAEIVKNKCKHKKIHVWVSPVWKIFKKTNNLLIWCQFPY